jgi:hypothetical protein
MSPPPTPWLPRRSARTWAPASAAAAEEKRGTCARQQRRGHGATFPAVACACEGRARARAWPP